MSIDAVSRWSSHRLVRVLPRPPFATAFELAGPDGARVWLKVLEGAADADAARRFEAEASALRAVDSPHVVRVLDAFVRPGPLFCIVEPALSGCALATCVARSGRLARPLALRHTTQVLAGLEAIHARGLVHRGVSTDTVLVGRERGEHAGRTRAILVDLALAVTSGDGPTTGHVIGRPACVAPEQIVSGRLDARTDVYAVGVLLHELLAGRPPFVGRTAADVFAAHLDLAPPPLAAFDPSLAPIDGVLACALAKRPDERFADAASFRRVLEAIADTPFGAALAAAPARGLVA